jgi:predicted enzyme related to lactoylglutathione lyase
MGLRSLDMVQIQCKDWPKVVEWYQHHLSLNVVAREDDDQFCLMALPEGKCVFAFYGVKTVELGSRSRCIPSILVDNLHATLAELRTKGVSVDREPGTDDDDGYRLATIADCEGNLIHLFEWTQR